MIPRVLVYLSTPRSSWDLPSPESSYGALEYIRYSTYICTVLTVEELLAACHVADLPTCLPRTQREDPNILSVDALQFPSAPRPSLSPYYETTTQDSVSVPFETSNADLTPEGPTHLLKTETIRPKNEDNNLDGGGGECLVSIPNGVQIKTRGQEGHLQRQQQQQQQ
ncbi:hypothetical protein BO82DRAFT_29202 [Aspergillus uvarum CBS 121591]|uniref:Uncharacterized protein n=1 Tax=Aspergillus uvarum CBS 121591 TaxID=1448315 RepID=A0A319CE35_9EURO|nr:hypothetical protein BO82DRAFT_29202 [Aspergillus uvarum CBS 121591]PYH83935.1 hypothetical protein BO82DRAFT_29202 [Aspergillus uvarum CBS 121591]